MLPIEGYLREKTGRAVNKIMAYRCVGSIKQTMNILQDDGKYVESEVVIKRWRLVAQKYFGFDEDFWHIKDHVFPLKLENETYGRGEVHVQAVDFDTGNHLFFGGVVMASPQAEPQELDRGVAREHIKAWATENKPKIIWGFLLLGVLVGCFIGFTVGQNAGVISHALGRVHV